MRAGGTVSCWWGRLPSPWTRGWAPSPGSRWAPSARSPGRGRGRGAWSGSPQSRGAATVGGYFDFNKTFNIPSQGFDYFTFFCFPCQSFWTSSWPPDWARAAPAPRPDSPPRPCCPRAPPGWTGRQCGRRRRSWSVLPGACNEGSRRFYNHRAPPGWKCLILARSHLKHYAKQMSKHGT